MIVRLEIEKIQGAFYEEGRKVRGELIGLVGLRFASQRPKEG